MKTFDDFVALCCEQINLPEIDIRRCLALHLKEAGIIPQHVVLYINYPEHTEQELAVAFDLSKSTVDRALARVRAVWPALSSDLRCGQHGSPAVQHMLRYVPSMDEQITQKF